LDSSSSSGLTIVLDPKNALSFDYIADVQFPDVARGVNYDVGTEYDLYFKFKDQILSSNYTGVGVSCPNANIGAITSVDGNNKYKFKLTPTTASTNQITVTNARDVNSFIYPSFSSLANLTFNAVLAQPFIYLDASDESLFVYNATSKVISAITVPNMTFASVGGKWTSNFLNGKGVIDFTGQTGIIVSNSLTSALGSSSIWSISFLIQANSSVGAYSASYIGNSAVRMADNFQNPQSFTDAYPFSIGGGINSSTTFTVADNWYLFTISRNGSSSDTYYYINNIFCGSGSQGNSGDLKQFCLNTFHTGVSGSPGQKRFAEVRVYKSYFSSADVNTLYQSVKSKWGI
jgi:hypothetical protein